MCNKARRYLGHAHVVRCGYPGTAGLGEPELHCVEMRGESYSQARSISAASRTTFLRDRCLKRWRGLEALGSTDQVNAVNQHFLRFHDSRDDSWHSFTSTSWLPHGFTTALDPPANLEASRYMDIAISQPNEYTCSGPHKHGNILSGVCRTTICPHFY